MATDIDHRLVLEAAQCLLRELKDLEPLQEEIASLLPTRSADSGEHWWVQPGSPVPANPAPDRLSSKAWHHLVRLSHQHVRASRRLAYVLRELRLTCTPDASSAGDRIAHDVVEFGHVLHVLGSAEDARGCIDQLNDDADVFVRLLRDEQGLPALTDD